MTTFEKVRDMLAKQLNVPAESIKEDSKIVEDLKADSLDVVEMLMNLEDAYSVSITCKTISRGIISPYGI